VEKKMAKGITKWILYLASAGLIILGILFVMASYANSLRLIEGIIFIGLAILILYFSREKKKVEIKQTVTVSGPIKVKEIRCPHCSALLNPEKTNVIDGRPFVKCNYCGNTFEITEEPTW
jgi:hypothetical protein